jgi:hypothetical protein
MGAVVKCLLLARNCSDDTRPGLSFLKLMSARLTNSTCKAVFRDFIENFKLSNSPNAARSYLSTLCNSEAVSLVSVICPVLFARYSLIGSPGAKRHFPTGRTHR